jgi:hypothetical protein
MSPATSTWNGRRWATVALALIAAAAFAAVSAGQASALTWQGYSTTVGFVKEDGNLGIFWSPEWVGYPGTVFPKELQVATGTSPGSGGIDNSQQISQWTAAQGTDGALWINGSPYQPMTRETLGMAAKTSPSITAGGGFAFQSNASALWVNHTNTGQGMRAGTSPSVLSNGTAAFQANTGHLMIWYTGLGSGIDTGLGMAAESSPSITDLGGGAYEVAFRANTGHLWTYCSCSGAHDTGLGVETGTSPSIADIGVAGWMVAFSSAGTHNLWTLTSSGVATNRGVGIYSASSPSISYRETESSESWQIAFQSKTHNLSYYGPLTGGVETSYKMRAASSPSIAP